MKTADLTSAIIAAIILSSSGALQAVSVTCHLHTPGNDINTENEPSIIRSVGKPQQCEQLNQEMFSGRGRCHCTIDSIKPRKFYLPEANDRDMPLM